MNRKNPSVILFLDKEDREFQKLLHEKLIELVKLIESKMPLCEDVKKASSHLGHTLYHIEQALMKSGKYEQDEILPVTTH